MTASEAIWYTPPAISRALHFRLDAPQCVAGGLSPCMESYHAIGRSRECNVDPVPLWLGHVVSTLEPLAGGLSLFRHPPLCTSAVRILGDSKAGRAGHFQRSCSLCTLSIFCPMKCNTICLYESSSFFIDCNKRIVESNTYHGKVHKLSKWQTEKSPRSLL